MNMRIEDELKSRFRNEYHKLMVNLMLTTSRLGECFHQTIKEYDITPTQYNVLRILRGQNQKPVSIGLIKERMIDRNSDVSRILERLVQKKLVERTENAEDRRQKDVRISKAGLDLLKEIDTWEKDMDKRFVHISDDEAKKINDMLDNIRTGF